MTRFDPRLLCLVVSVVASSWAGPSVAASQEESAAPPAAKQRRVLIESNSLTLRARDVKPKTLNDLGTEEAANIRAINRTRGTWQSYLGYTSELPVPLLKPGFIITLPPPTKKAREAQRKEEKARKEARASSQRTTR